MYKFASLLIASVLTLAPPAKAQDIPAETPLRDACQGITAIPDACPLIAEAATLLAPTYRIPKSTGEAELRRMGYEARYIPADTSWVRPTTDVFLVGRRASGRLFVVITGTETWDEWVSNTFARPYTGTYVDSQFYAPPAHGGFRGGLLNIIEYGVLRENEFDTNPLRCDRPRSQRSLLAEFLCASGIQRGQEKIELVIVGHSRGAGIGIVSATAFMGLEVNRPANGAPASIVPQGQWPLRLHAIIAIAPPYAVSRRSDRDEGVNVPSGIPDHDTILEQYGVPERTILIANDRDVVPLLGFGQVLHRGHLFRVRRDRSVVYERRLRPQPPGTPEAERLDGGLVEAHRSAGYCHDIMRALDAPVQCDPRTTADPN